MFAWKTLQISMFGAHEAMITSAKATLIMGRLMDYNNVSYVSSYPTSTHVPSNKSTVCYTLVFSSNKSMKYD